MRRRTLGRLVALGALAGLLGVGVVVTGMVPLSAAEGHWGITEWLFQAAKRRTLAARALWIDPPPLDDPALVLRGAGHYELGCRPCHGTASDPPPRTLTEMLPTPPFLPERLDRLGPGELFWVVKNGIKLTGMPGWPSQRREDEVWAMVAFLERLPELGPDEYARLARNEEIAAGDEGAEPEAARPLAALTGDPPAPVVETCRRCHGEDGQGRGVGAYPRLAGQPEAYLLAQLRAFSAGSRHSGTMETVAAALSAETMAELAAYYAAQAPDPTVHLTAADVPSTAASSEIVPSPHEKPGATAGLRTADAAALARGRAIAQRGIPARKVPSCVDCHGPVERRRNPRYPRLAGQYPEYLALQLELFKEGRRGGSDYEHVMRPIAEKLQPEEMRDVALWFASLPASAAGSEPP
ncbi:MAG TPA: c-type cytochrome [Thermoanaerobaculia bacterium]|nr:c-type cytochrome [Thermoanaerobaculia bacterium]